MSGVRGDMPEPPVLATPVDELMQQTRAVVRWAWELRWWLLAAVVGGGGLGAGTAMTVLRKQTATAMITVLQPQLENPLGAFERKSIRFFHAPVHTFTADALVQTTLSRIDGREPSPRELYQTRKDLRITDYGDDVYVVEYANQDGVRAVRLLEEHLRTYVDAEQQRNLAALRREVERLRGGLAAMTARMQATEAQVRDFKTANQSSLPEYAGENLANLRLLERRVVELDGQLNDVQAEREQLARLLEREPATTPVETRTSTPMADATSDRLGRVRAEIAALRAAGVREQHPELARLLAEERQLLEMERQATPRQTASSVEMRPNERRVQLQQRADLLALETERLSRQLAAASQRVIDAQRIVQRTPDLEQRYAELSRGQEADRKTYMQMSQVLEMALLQLRLEEEAAPTRLEIASPPRLQFSSQAMRVTLLGVLGACAGAGLVALGWAMVRLRRLVWPSGLMG